MIAEQSEKQLILHIVHRRWSSSKAQRLSGKSPGEWNIFRRYFIDPDYGLSVKSGAFPLAKKKRQTQSQQGLTRDTSIIVALIRANSWQGKEGKRAAYCKEARVSSVTLAFISREREMSGLSSAAGRRSYRQSPRWCQGWFPSWSRSSASGLHWRR